MVKTVAELYNPEEEWVISVIDEKPGIGRSCVLRVLLYYYSTWCVLSVLLSVLGSLGCWFFRRPGLICSKFVERIASYFGKKMIQNMYF
jgi:hypothetical protein